MAKIKRLWLFTVTSKESVADTCGEVCLEMVLRNGYRTWVNIGHPNRNDRECGQTACHELALSDAAYVDDAQIQELQLRIGDQHDAWLPKSIWVLSKNVDGGIKLLSADPEWNQWFDSKSKPGYALNLVCQ